jgi:hypothetical protein
MRIEYVVSVEGFGGGGLVTSSFEEAIKAMEFLSLGFGRMARVFTSGYEKCLAVCNGETWHRPG